MRVALVHDWLTGLRGGERVLEELARMYPEAELYTLINVPGSTSATIAELQTFASPLSRVPGIARNYRGFLPLYPWAISRFYLEGYDLIVSVSHAVAKAIPHDTAIPHVSYCLTPMRYIWDQSHHYWGTGLYQKLSIPLVAYLRRFDQQTSRPEQVSQFVSISSAISDRIETHYGRTSEVVWPPVDVERIRPNALPPDDFYLLVGGFVPYKCERIAIEAFRSLKRRLVVVGEGPMRSRLATAAPPNVEFRGRVDDAELADLYARCRALIYPQEEDFGIVAVEAQAAGRPVIAFGRGGARDTVVPVNAPGISANREPTGIWFTPQTSKALAEAVVYFEENESALSSEAIREWAKRFGRDRFRRELGDQIRNAVDGSRQAPPARSPNDRSRRD